MMKTKTSNDLLNYINKTRNDMGTAYRGDLLVKYHDMHLFVEAIEKLERQLEKLENKKLTCEDE